MDRREALKIAREILDAHGLQDWRVVFDDRKRRLGACRYATREIILSAPYVDANGRDIIEETARHETAHALAGPTAGHGSAWRAACLVTGARPERCADVAAQGIVVPAGSYVVRCPRADCDRRQTFYRAPRRARVCPVHREQCIVEKTLK